MSGSTGHVESKGVIQVVGQKKVPVGDPWQAVADTVEGLQPIGIPSNALRQVRESMDECKAQIVAILASIRITSASVAAGVNRITRNDEEYVLQTSNGKFIVMKDCPQNRPLLMLLVNCGMTVPLLALVDSATFGHWKLASEDSKWVGATSETDDKNDDKPSYDDELHTSSTSLGEAITKEGMQKYKIRLLEIAKMRQEAKAKQDDDRLDALDTEANEIEKELVRTTTKTIYRRNRQGKVFVAVPSRPRHDHTREEACHIHRMRVYLDRTIQLIEKRDGELGAYLNGAVTRNGTFCFDGDPAIQWDICDRPATPILVNSKVCLPVQEPIREETKHDLP
jgi:hypothetical protein